MPRLGRRGFLQAVGGAAAMAAAAPAMTADRPSEFSVVGYLPWYRLKAWTATQAGPLTDLVYFGVQPTSDGELPADPIDRASSRPDFLILGYPVITFEAGVTHAGSVRNLLGENPDPKLIELMSNELHVTPQTPPTFLFHTNADTGVVPENSIRFYMALRKAKVPAEMHIFENGPHGVGLALGDPALGAWPVLLTNWLRGRGLLTRAQ